MLVTLSGIATDVRPLQPLNAPSATPLTFSIIRSLGQSELQPTIHPSTRLRPFIVVVSYSNGHPSNASNPILVTLSGIITDVRPLQPENVLSQMNITPFGIVTDIRLLQSRNASSPMRVTLSGIVTDIRRVQSRNAYAPMRVTLSGIVTDVRPLQPENA